MISTALHWPLPLPTDRYDGAEPLTTVNHREQRLIPFGRYSSIIAHLGIMCHIIAQLGLTRKLGTELRHLGR